MSSNRELNKNIFSERSQNNNLAIQNGLIDSNNHQISNQNNDEEKQKDLIDVKENLFDIDALELENLMGKYKERGNDYQKKFLGLIKFLLNLCVTFVPLFGMP